MPVRNRKAYAFYSIHCLSTCINFSNQRYQHTAKTYAEVDNCFEQPTKGTTITNIPRQRSPVCFCYEHCSRDNNHLSRLQTFRHSQLLPSRICLANSKTQIINVQLWVRIDCKNDNLVYLRESSLNPCDPATEGAASVPELALLLALLVLRSTWSCIHRSGGFRAAVPFFGPLLTN